MIIIFTPHDRPAAGPAGRPPARSTERRGPTPNRPLPGTIAEEEAVFTDPFGPVGASAR